MASDLLHEFQPAVRFESREAFFAHDVRAMADNADLRVTCADQAGAGSVIATTATASTSSFSPRPTASTPATPWSRRGITSLLPSVARSSSLTGPATTGRSSGTWSASG